MSYINVLEELTAPGPFPFEMPIFILATSWRREAEGEELRIRVRFKDVSGVESELTAGPFPFEKQRHRLNIRIPGLEATEFGTLFFSIDVLEEDDWVEVAVVPFTIRQAAEAIAEE